VVYKINLDQEIPGKLGVTFVLFCKDVGQGAENTVFEVSAALEKHPSLESQIVVVDDGSNEWQFDEQKFKDLDIDVVRLGTSLGISGAILAGTQIARFDNLFPVPGHDMYSATAISNVLNLLNSADIIIGCRSNLAAERPLFKRIASRVMRDLYRHFFFYYVGDVHGLISYKKRDVIKYLKNSDKHGQNIRIITNVISQGGLVVQTVAPIKIGHKLKRNVNFKNRYPNPQSTLHVIKLLINLKLEMKKYIIN
jgi:hypothetical protein